MASDGDKVSGSPCFGIAVACFEYLIRWDVGLQLAELDASVPVSVLIDAPGLVGGRRHTDVRVE